MQLSPEEQNKMNTPEYRIRRAAAFQRVFSGADGELVKRELAIECRATALLVNFGSAQHQYRDRTDPFLLAVTAGKKDVWTFIQNCLEVDTKKAIEVLKNASDKEK